MLAEPHSLVGWRPVSPRILSEIRATSRILPLGLGGEEAYWAVRDQILNQYDGQWIGFADGLVIASGSSPVTVFHAAEATGRHPFFICVGREQEPCHIRRVSFFLPRRTALIANPILPNQRSGNARKAASSRFFAWPALKQRGLPQGPINRHQTRTSVNQTFQSILPQLHAKFDAVRISL